MANNFSNCRNYSTPCQHTQHTYSFRKSIKHFMQKVLFTLNRTVEEWRRTGKGRISQQTGDDKKQLKYRNTNKDQQLWQ